jgi:hypothetical protein
MADGPARYGYLPNDASKAGLPVGFAAVSRRGWVVMGMTCAACHTRQIEVAGTADRIDGGPARVDFQSFLSDLDVAVDAVLTDGGAFADFACAVVNAPPTLPQQAALRQEVADWYERYHALMTVAPPKSSPWGVGRHDAVQMIFNRLTGLDFGTAAELRHRRRHCSGRCPGPLSFSVECRAAEPNQWLGFAANGNDLFALSATLAKSSAFHPRRQPLNFFLGMNYWADNSANLAGLRAAEALGEIKAP